MIWKGLVGGHFEWSSGRFGLGMVEGYLGRFVYYDGKLMGSCRLRMW